jgi:plastocyanin
MRKAVWVIMAVALSGLIYGCSKVVQTPVSTDKVMITEKGFVPPVIRVSVGTTVTWENADTKPHAIWCQRPGTTSEPIFLLFDSGKLLPKEKFKFKFTEVGQFRYRNRYYDWMSGTVIVTR